MKSLACCLPLLFATVVVTTPIRDALSATTAKNIPAPVTAYEKPPSKPVKEPESEDVSDVKSTESFDTNRFKDPDSHEIRIPQAVEKVKIPSQRKTVEHNGNVGPMNMSSRLVQEQGSREHDGPPGELQASREPADLNGKEGVTVDAQLVRLSRDQVTDNASLSSNLKRKATPGRADGLKGVLAPGRNKELADQDSVEDDNHRAWAEKLMFIFPKKPENLSALKQIQSHLQSTGPAARLLQARTEPPDDRTEILFLPHNESEAAIC
ncbi:uncharacterized protein LOC119006418 isoform X4 [Acanthopagrus latus]|uniref:uncharacterized protein LOC119006418 isoform X4 n=1 Tax=Acanthopagrus latus TaxID=8177 RepID=UPI00187BC7BB|nr:uncharacterized protein LOC119006418 isoform X4 [Acanthopagrus latus]